MADGKGTTLAGAMSDNTALGEYLGKKVASTSIAIRNAGDGLSEAMSIAPEILTPGDTVYVLLECQVADHVHAFVEKHDVFELKQVLKAGTATIVDDQASQRKIAQQANRLKKAAESKTGTQRIPGTEDAIDGLRPVPDWGDNENGDDDDGDGADD